MPLRSTGWDTDEDDEIDLYSHEKQLLINGNYGGVRNRKLIVTGSSNYQDGGQYGDELIVRKFDYRLYRAYADHWRGLWDWHSHAFGELAIPPGNSGRERSAIVPGGGIDVFDWRDE